MQKSLKKQTFTVLHTKKKKRNSSNWLDFITIAIDNKIDKYSESLKMWCVELVLTLMTYSSILDHHFMQEHQGVREEGGELLTVKQKHFKDS